MSGLTQQQIEAGAALCGIQEGCYEILSNEDVGEGGVAARAILRAPPEGQYCGAQIDLLDAGNLSANSIEIDRYICTIMQTTAPGGAARSADTITKAKAKWSCPDDTETQYRINEVMRNLMLEDPEA